MRPIMQTVSGGLMALLAGCATYNDAPDKGAQVNQQAVASVPKSLTQPQGEQPRFQLSAELKAKIIQLERARAALFTDSVPCQYMSGGVCPILVQVVVVDDPQNNTEYCAALFPEEVSLGKQTGNKKQIVWQLLPPPNPPAGATFTFFDASSSVDKAPGIIVVKDPKTQLRDGKLGNGTSTTADATYYMMTHMHNAKNLAVYLPIVVRTDAAVSGQPAKVSVCATPDPRIAND